MDANGNGDVRTVMKDTGAHLEPKWLRARDIPTPLLGRRLVQAMATAHSTANYGRLARARWSSRACENTHSTMGLLRVSTQMPAL